MMISSPFRYFSDDRNDSLVLVAFICLDFYCLRIKGLFESWHMTYLSYRLQIYNVSTKLPKE